MTKENPLHKIMNADSVAFYGASNRATAMGTQQALHLVNGGYKGKVYFVHPSEKTVLGLEAYRSIDEVPEIPDMAMMVLPTTVVPEKMLECAKKGIKSAVITSGGFNERGGEGVKLEEQVVEIANEYGMRFVGPNCIGVINSKKNFNLTFFPYFLGEGPLGMVSQSGTYVTQSLPYLERFGLRFSKAVSLGNEANIDLVDGIEYMGEDEDTKAIILYIETIRRPREFMEVAKRVSMKKPIVAYYVGGTEAGSRSGFSHTGAMGGSDEIHDAVFKQCGIIRAGEIQDMYEWSWALATQPLPKGRRVAIISQSGGGVTAMADASSREGLEVPILSEAAQESIREHVPATGSTQNPVDLTFSMKYDAITNIIPNILYDSGEVDAVFVHGIMMKGYMSMVRREAGDDINVIRSEKGNMREMSAAMSKDFIALSHEKGCPVLISTFSDREDDIINYLVEKDMPVYPLPERAVYAFSAMVRYAEWVRARKG